MSCCHLIVTLKLPLGFMAAGRGIAHMYFLLNGIICASGFFTYDILTFSPHIPVASSSAMSIRKRYSLAPLFIGKLVHGSHICQK